MYKVKIYLPLSISRILTPPMTLQTRLSNFPLLSVGVSLPCPGGAATGARSLLVVSKASSATANVIALKQQRGLVNH